MTLVAAKFKPFKPSLSQSMQKEKQSIFWQDLMVLKTI